MKYLRYGLLFFLKHKVTYLLMLVQLILLMLAENMLIANLNSRDVLYAPYEDIISKNGYYFMPPYSSGGIWDEEGHIVKTSEEVLEDVLSKLKGEYKVYNIYSSSIENDKGSVAITIIDDEIYHKLKLPLDSGHHSSKKNSCMVTKNDKGLDVGTILNIDGAKIEITGVLTDNTYIPDYGTYDIDMGLMDLYRAYTYSGTGASSPVDDGDMKDMMDSYYTDKTEIIAPVSAFEEQINASGSTIYKGNSVLLVFNSPLSEEDRLYNEEVLIAEDCDEPGLLMPFEQINKKALIYRNEDFNKMLPLVICIIVVIFVGIICSSAIITAKQLRKFALLYINGATTKDCVIISCVTALISSVVALVIALLVLFLGIVNSFANDLGFVWGLNNLVAIAATVIFITLSFGIIPGMILSRKKYVLITEN